MLLFLLADLRGELKMTFAQVKKYFENKRDADCCITNELIANGYRQKKWWLHKDSMRLRIK